jgi:ABC-type nitrate/sulfonate/bicarbonate transport system permease component
VSRIAVLGTGVVGQTIASKLVEVGHEVMMGSRSAGNERAVEWAAGAGDGASEGTFADAAGFGEIVVNATAGAQRTPRILLRAALMLGTPPHKLLYRVVLPAALPSIFTGLRLGMGIAWVLVIVSEMLAVKGGLGYSLWTAYQFQRMDLIIASMFSVGGLGYLFDRILVAVAGRTLRWAQGQ